MIAFYTRSLVALSFKTVFASFLRHFFNYDFFKDLIKSIQYSLMATNKTPVTEEKNGFF